MHSKVQYIVAHGISTTINDKKAVIGSYHFVFEDEKCIIPAGMEQRFEELPSEYSHLYLAIEGVLEAVICIEDPLREEAAAVVNSLKCAGISKVVMMTGDSERTASAIAKRVGVDEYYSEVLPEDKAAFVEKEKAAGRKVIMIGDGINDSPALSAADKKFPILHLHSFRYLYSLALQPLHQFFFGDACGIDPHRGRLLCQKCRRHLLGTLHSIFILPLTD